MSDPQREEFIKQVTEMIEDIWVKYQDLRLGQLMENMLGCGCMFHRADDEVARTLKMINDQGFIPDVRE